MAAIARVRALHHALTVGIAPSQKKFALDLDAVRGPVLLADTEGLLWWSSLEARELLTRTMREGTPRSVPARVWDELETVASGMTVSWRDASSGASSLECSRYRAGAHWMIVLRESALEHVSIAKALHRQRLEVTGRLVASIAHELRNSVSSIVYSADVLQLHESLPEGEFEDSVREIMEASRRLQATVDGLLDYARLGPSVSVPVSLREVLTRAQGFLGPYYRSGSHRLRVAIAADADSVQGNSIVVEQIFVNLLLNAAEASDRPITVQVQAEVAAHPATARPMVRVRVKDDGPGVSDAIRDRLFEPFVTGRERGTGLGLTNSREAVESLGGAIVLEDERPGATFSVYLPRSQTP